VSHPHDLLIRSWLNGDAVQYRQLGADAWIDLEPAATVRKLPQFRTDGTSEYRIKPLVIRHRVAIIKTSGRVGTESVNTVEQEAVMKKSARFVRWLTDWTEVVV
jgi:hypothetical protein